MRRESHTRHCLPLRLRSPDFALERRGPTGCRLRVLLLCQCELGNSIHWTNGHWASPRLLSPMSTSVVPNCTSALRVGGFSPQLLRSGGPGAMSSVKCGTAAEFSERMSMDVTYIHRTFRRQAESLELPEISSNSTMSFPMLQRTGLH